MRTPTTTTTIVSFIYLFIYYANLYLQLIGLCMATRLADVGQLAMVLQSTLFQDTKSGIGPTHAMQCSGPQPQVCWILPRSGSYFFFNYQYPFTLFTYSFSFHFYLDYLHRFHLYFNHGYDSPYIYFLLPI